MEGSHSASSGSQTSTDLSSVVRAASSPEAVGSSGQAEKTDRSSKDCTSVRHNLRHKLNLYSASCLENQIIKSQGMLQAQMSIKSFNC